MTCKIDRYAQLLHDTYLVLTLPDIWSPMVPVSTAPSGYDSGCTAVGYEFQWIKNIGYNMIDHVEIVANGVKLQVLTGEWLKMYSYFTHDENKRRVVDRMVGNVTEMYDPANAYDRTGQYPHAVTPTGPGTAFPYATTPEPSIRSRQLVIPLHFWFCENPGLALPLGEAGALVAGLHHREAVGVARPVRGAGRAAALVELVQRDGGHSNVGRNYRAVGYLGAGHRAIGQVCRGHHAVAQRTRDRGRPNVEQHQSGQDFRIYDTGCSRQFCERQAGETWISCEYQ